MIYLAVIVAVVVLVLLVGWARVAGSRADRRSMQNYEHTLQVLGQVTRRSEHPAHGPRTVEEPVPANSPPREEDGAPTVAAAPLVVEPEALRFDDTAGPAAPPDPRRALAPPPLGGRRPSFGRAAAVAAGIVVLAGAAAGVYEAGVFSSKGPNPASLRPGGSRHHRRRTSTTTTTTTTPSEISPVSSSATEVGFVAPKGSYTVEMTDAGGPCWVGISQTTQGAYLWEETLESGGTATYNASGPLVVRIGAPQYLGVSVNGVPLRLPGYVQPYDVMFNPSTATSSA